MLRCRAERGGGAARGRHRVRVLEALWGGAVARGRGAGLEWGPRAGCGASGRGRDRGLRPGRVPRCCWYYRETAGIAAAGKHGGPAGLAASWQRPLPAGVPGIAASWDGAPHRQACRATAAVSSARAVERVRSARPGPLGRSPGCRCGAPLARREGPAAVRAVPCRQLRARRAGERRVPQPRCCGHVTDGTADRFRRRPQRPSPARAPTALARPGPNGPRPPSVHALLWARDRGT